MSEKLPKELSKLQTKTRVCLGTMTDPYQPIEREHRITRTALQILRRQSSMISKVGIYTRSPIVEEDADLIAQLPNNRVHLSITPFPKESMRLVEKIPISTHRRWLVAQNLVQRGVRVHINIAPAIPLLSEGMAEEYVQRIVESGVSEFFVDPIQPYNEAIAAMKEGLAQDPRWDEIEEILRDKKYFDVWKAAYRAEWYAAWAKYGRRGTLALWQDHSKKIYEDMSTGKSIDPRTYDGI